jgi:hypothetical protein
MKQIQTIISQNVCIWTINLNDKLEKFLAAKFYSLINTVTFVVQNVSRKYSGFRILQLQNMRRLEVYKQQWWNENPFAKNCDEVSGGDSGGGISIYNIG